MTPVELAERHEVLVLEPRATFDRALVGVTDKPKDHWPRKGGVFVAEYSIPLCIKAMMQDNEWGEEEATEFFEFNTAGAWVGEGTPTFVMRRTPRKGAP